MRNNEGEFELVLGNRQLLSGFFVVALLFGVAFAMGYIVGRNSIPSPKAQVEAAAPAAVAAGSRPQPAPPEPPLAEQQAPAPADDATAAPGTQPAAEPDPTTQPAREGPTAAPPTQTEARQSAAPPAAGVTEPEPGTYWQVTAIAQPQAEVFARVLRDKGFRVSLSPGTKNLTRVLVGPYPDRESLGRAKSDLEGSGFHPVILKKE
jgi:cell division septation protein DedD